MVAFGKACGGGRRAGKREDTPLAVVLTTRAGSHKAVLVDISETGARVRSDDLPDVEDELVLGVEGLRIFGTVRWMSGGDCGLEFDQPLPKMDVVSLRLEVARGAGLPVEFKAAMDDWVRGVAR